MLKSFKVFVLIFMVIASSNVFAKVPIAVQTIEDKSAGSVDCRIGWDYWWGYLSNGAFRDQLTTELMKKGKFEIYEREHIGSILNNEINLPNSHNSQKKLKTGQFKQAKFIIAGSLTEFDYCTENNSSSVNVGRVLSLFSGENLPDLEIGKTGAKAHIAFDIRVINTETGEIMNSFSVEDEKNDSGYSISSSGIFNVESEQNSPMGKAFRSALTSAANQISQSIN